VIVKRDRIAGAALIAGSLGVIVTMALHPIGGNLRTDAERLLQLTNVARGVHVLAIVSVVVQAFGFWGLADALGLDKNRVRAGFVALILGWIAVIGAAIASGLLAPELIERYADVDPSERPAMHVAWDYNGLVNQVLARIFIVATAIGVGLWSLVTWGYGRAWRIVSMIGGVVLVGGIAVVLSGVHMDVSHFGLTIAVYSVWVVAAAMLLLRGDGEGPGNVPASGPDQSEGRGG
jgi:hypothetical protein